ncbi:DMT family transporter [Paracoccus sp. M683]|uniref:DMT family transporter n=1 Tax=Paracoccus sp. M683 TaxID=2594268 RepID=UPI0011805298|nr:DMT family transporter [Paracoccus sp. M683]TRW98200.1 DMT family transporter [Paracoccus sp. M683]
MRLLAILIALGLVWGLQVSLTKFATLAGFRDFGITFWVSIIDAALLLPMVGRLPLHAGALRVYAFVGLVGTTLPSTASVIAAQHLPAGLVAVGLSFAPLIALPVAVLMGTDRFSVQRVLGLLAGLIGVVLIVAPGTGLAGGAISPLFLLALIAPFFYALEGNVLARHGTAGLAPMQMVAGAAIVSMVITGPAAVIRGSFIPPGDLLGPAGAAVLGGAILSVFAYVGYLWLIGRAGAVFAVQVSYLVTGFGVMWSMLILSERFPPGFWIALAVVMLGVFLVQPRPPSLQAALESGKNAPDGAMGDDNGRPQ